VRGGNTYPKTRSCPYGRQHTDIKMSCLWTVVYVLTVLRSRWSGLSFWHSCEPAFKILLHLGTWICASYACWLLSICAQLWWKIVATPPLIWYIYMHTHEIPFFWIAVLFMMVLSLIFVLHIKAIRPCWGIKGSTS
jgi:hypothetical protein